jgi:hypothetical protein
VTQSNLEESKNSLEDYATKIVRRATVILKGGWLNLIRKTFQVNRLKPHGSYTG